MSQLDDIDLQLGEIHKDRGLGGPDTTAYKAKTLRVHNPLLAIDHAVTDNAIDKQERLDRAAGVITITRQP